MFNPIESSNNIQPCHLDNPHLRRVAAQRRESEAPQVVLPRDARRPPDRLRGQEGGGRRGRQVASAQDPAGRRPRARNHRDRPRAVQGPNSIDNLILGLILWGNFERFEIIEHLGDF